MEPDYPAAHSMTVAWFAVDAAGHVGYFYSSEAGSVPAQVADGDNDLTERLAEHLPHVEALEDLRGRLGPDGEEDHCAYALPNYPLLIFLDSPKPIRDEIEARRARQVPGTEGVAFVLEGTSKEVYDRLHDAGLCRGCFWYSYRDDSESSPAQLGFYYYQHPISNVFSFPYDRLSIPVRPLHIDQLPPELRKAVAQVALKIDFATTLHIQPPELVPCESYECAYLDSTGKHLRPIPGKEADYAKAVDDLVERYGERFEVFIPPHQRPKKKRGTDGS